MTRLKNTVLKKSMKWHKWLGWAGGFALLLFAVSAMTHPLMLWTGPRAVSFFPPQLKLQSGYVAGIPAILEQHNINQARIIKVVPAAPEPLLQITIDNGKTRRYFDLKSGKELKDYDRKHAIWLARFYSGLKDTEIKHIRFQTKFDNSYPWVNRLLPVYRITFNTEDNRTLFIHTELGALGNITNNWKTSLQTIFQTLHTWNWLNDYEYLRTGIMTLLLLALLSMAIAGLSMIFLMKSRTIKEGRRRWHRYTAIIIWVPLLMLSVSGLYHLLYQAFPDNNRERYVAAPVKLDPSKFTKDTEWLAQFEGKSLNNLSIIKSPKGELLYRLSMPNGKPGHKISKSHHFNGAVHEKRAWYISTETGTPSNLTDRETAIHYAGKYTGYNRDLISETRLITRFSPLYDFRNKRLPVWQIDYKTGAGDTVFIDAANAILVDRITNPARYESLSFSMLHKWNFITPFIGRFPRDIITVLILSLAIALTILGYMMLLRRKRKAG